MSFETEDNYLYKRTKCTISVSWSNALVLITPGNHPHMLQPIELPCSLVPHFYKIIDDNLFKYTDNLYWSHKDKENKVAGETKICIRPTVWVTSKLQYVCTHLQVQFPFM